MDGSKEQTLGFFRNKCQEAGCHMNQTELYSTCKLQAKGDIRGMKKGAGRKMFRYGAPKEIWDDALEFEAYKRFHTAMDFICCKGESLRH